MGIVFGPESDAYGLKEHLKLKRKKGARTPRLIPDKKASRKKTFKKLFYFFCGGSNSRVCKTGEWPLQF